MENDFRITEINATFTKKQNLLRWQEQRIKRIIRNGNFVLGASHKRTKGVKQRNLPPSSFPPYYYYYYPDKTLYSSFIGVKTVKSVSRIWGQNNGN